MVGKGGYLTAGAAARRLGLSVKTLRVYERYGLLTPDRTASGWRHYGPRDMARAADIARLRDLGLSLAEVGDLLSGDIEARKELLGRHACRIEGRIRRLAASRCAVDDFRREITQYSAANARKVAINLPWPWADEVLEVGVLPRLTFLTGPLGSGKTRLAKCLAESLPGGQFLSLDRMSRQGRSYRERLLDDPELADLCRAALDTLETRGAARSPALTALVAALVDQGDGPLVVDMVEEGLDAATQAVLVPLIRHDLPRERPFILMTRSSAILALEKMESGEAVIYCPANHGRPIIVTPDRGLRGYESVADCLATPEVRARTAGVIAWHPQSASFPVT